ncbi:leucyl/phenylalanyl-tRNA--protein transferase [Intrasporangium sp. YIM S08009]|uniref:leucyl/phenylalanyl-tRNA--protein transferase n=1 Tax=Intrasporangium zincisolvens TaxID=3080018 RepID=UPI002B054A69|nr:leucyl/phenylalanyl-tRNA--protein transferase [Intrasporangium sp. YIM S08009]
MPTPPPPTAWDFALDRVPPGEDLIGIGADLEVPTLYEAYSIGVFPMGIGDHGAEPIGWWSPDPRGVLRPDGLRVTRSLRKARGRFEVRVDTAFEDVVAACAEPDREGRWITPQIARAYTELHRAGWAHSVETWQDDRLVGGLYGVAIGGLFAGESMFHHVTDASKVALVGLCELLRADGDPRRVVDVQWQTPHLATLGVLEVTRDEYLAMLPDALRAPLPEPWR